MLVLALARASQPLAAYGAFHAGRKSPTRAIHPPRTAALDGNGDARAHFYARGGSRWQLGKNGKLNGELLEIEILMFCQILEDNRGARWQWRCARAFLRAGALDGNLAKMTN